MQSAKTAKNSSQLILFYLDYSRVKAATDARHRAWSRGASLRMPSNEEDALRSARL